MAAQRRPRRLGRRLVRGEARHALDRVGGLLDGSPGEGALDELLEPRDDGRALVVALAAEEVEERLGELAAHRLLGQRPHALPQALEGAQLDGRPRRPRQHGSREEGEMVLRVVPVDVLLAEQGDELRAEDLEVAGRSPRPRRPMSGGSTRGAPRGAGRGRERHALGGQLSHHAQHRVGGERGREGLQRLAPLGVGGERAQRGSHEAVAEGSGSRMISWAVCRAARMRPAPDMP